MLLAQRAGLARELAELKGRLGSKGSALTTNIGRPDDEARAFSYSQEVVTLAVPGSREEFLAANNHGVFCLQLFQQNGESKLLDQALDLLERAHAMASRFPGSRDANTSGL